MTKRSNIAPTSVKSQGDVLVNSNSKFRNSVGVRRWFALTPALSLVALNPLCETLRERGTRGARNAPKFGRGSKKLSFLLRLLFSQNWEKGLGDEGKGAGTNSIGFEFGIAGWLKC
jgi:hypothetical protein